MILQMSIFNIQIFLLGGFFLFTPLSASADQSVKQEIESIKKESKFIFGTELDALPFITGGYYFSVISGLDPIRVRAVVSQVNLPDFAFDSSNFSKSSLHVYESLGCCSC